MRMPSEKNVSRRSFVKGAAGVGAVAAALGLAACGGSGSGDKKDDAAGDDAKKASFKVQMVTDTGGVNDQSFNQISWAGLQQLKEEEGWEVGYLESKQESDYKTNLDKAIDDGSDLVWGVGFAMADAIATAAKTNPDVKFAIIDNANPTGADNLTGVQFRAQEPSFMVGYIAACTSTTGKVGFVGGVGSDVIRLFEYGYMGGVAYANSVKGTNVEVQSQDAESVSDSAKGKGVANTKFQGRCDVIFHAAGDVGTGVIEAAKDAGKFAIGVDMDQSHLAPENVLTSALKRCDVAVVDISKKILSGEEPADVSLGAAEGCVGIPEDHKLMAEDVYNEAIEIETQIKDGKITPPGTEDEYNSYKASLA